MHTAHPEHAEPDEQPGHLTPTEVASRLGVDPSTVRRWAKRLPLGEKLVGRWRLDPDLIAAAITGAPPAGVTR